MILTKMSKHLMLALLLMVLGCWCVVRDDKDDWIDPYDMLNFDHGSGAMKNKPKTEPDSHINTEKEPMQKETTTTKDAGNEKIKAPPLQEDNKLSCPKMSPCVPLFRQYVKSLLHHVKKKVFAGAEDLNLRIKVTAADIEYLERYIDPSEPENNFHLAHEILARWVQHVSEVSHSDPSIHRLWIETILGIPLEKFIMSVVLAVLLFLTLVMASRLHFSWWKLSVKLTFFLFVISVFWQWYELYKKEEAKQHMSIMNEMPEGCRQKEKDASALSTVWRSLTSAFTFEKDECLQYYENLLITPFWKVPPTQALAKTLVRFFVSPAQDIGEAIRMFLTGLLKGLPAQLWPVALTGISVFSFLLLFMYFGYRFSLPFGIIAIEPGTRGDDDRVQKAIGAQAEELKSLKQSQEDQFKQILFALSEEQKALKQQLANQERVLALPRFQSLGDSTCAQAVSVSDPVPMLQGGDGHNNSKGEVDLPVRNQSSKDGSLNDTGVENVDGKCSISDIGSFEDISASQIEPDTIGNRDS